MKILITILVFSISSTCFAFLSTSPTIKDISDASTLKGEQIEFAKAGFNKVVWSFLSENHKVSNAEQLLKALSKTRSSFENEKDEESVRVLIERFAAPDNKDLRQLVKVNFDINQVSSFSEDKTKEDTRNGFLLKVYIESSVNGCFPIYYTTYILLEKEKLESAAGKDRGVSEEIDRYTFPCFG